MSIESKKQELLEELGFFHDWTERYEYVIGLGKKLKPFPVEKQTEDQAHQRMPISSVARCLTRGRGNALCSRFRLSDHQGHDCVVCPSARR